MRQVVVLSKAVRVVLERLDRRQLLAADPSLTSDRATALLESRIRSAWGIDHAAASSLIADGSAHANRADGVTLSDVPYLSKLSLATARKTAPSISAVSFTALQIDLTGVERLIRSAPHQSLARGASIRDLPVLSLPTPDGGIARFGMDGYDLLTPAVSALYPEIRSVRLYGLNDNTAYGQATITSSGLTATLSSPNGNWSVQPFQFNSNLPAYASFFDSHQLVSAADATEDANDEHVLDAPVAARGGSGDATQSFTIGTQLKTLRAVIGTSAEWTATFGTQAAAFNNVVSIVAAANVAFNRDIATTLQLASTTASIFTNAATDGYTNGNTDSMANENVNVMTSTYGLGTFDVGQAFGVGGSGVAYTFGGGVGSVGSSIKAKSASLATPNTVTMSQRYAHETGHQLGASHTWNDISTSTDSGRTADSAYEPGPGSTLMSYGGLGWAGNFVTVRDAVYHNHSIDQMDQALRTSASGVAAGSVSNTGNLVGQVEAGADRTIPANTPFELTAQGYDNQVALTYTWEQIDLGNEHAIGSDDGTGPLFRSRVGTANPTRMFPELDDVLANRIDPDEVLPTQARSANPLTFRVTIKDQVGGLSDDSIDLPVVNTGAAFAITSQNAAGTIWNASSNQTITWNVAGTTANGINTARVDIYISYDAGVTFTPIQLDVLNNGSNTVSIPANAPNTSTARIKVKGRGNYFFDINNAAIQINGTAALNGLPTTAPAVEAPIYASQFADIADTDFSILGGLNPFIDSAGDSDTYLFSPDTTGLYTIQAADDDTGSPSDVDTLLAVYDHITGAQLAINDDIISGNTDSSLTLILEDDKLYRITVGDYQANTAGNVSLIITSGAAITPTTVTLSSGVGNASGTFESGAIADFYSFTVPAAATTSRNIAYSSPTATMVASLYNSAGQLLLYSFDGSFDNAELAGLVAGSTYTLRVGVRDYVQGGGNYTVAINMPIAVTPAAPSSPDLLQDSGISSTDNLTNQNNNARFFITAGTSTQYIRLFRNGVQVGATAQPSVGTVGFIDDTTGPLPDGVYTYTATVSNTLAGPQSVASAATVVTIDATAPAAAVFDFRYNDGPTDHRFFIDFNEAVQLSASMVQVRNITTAQNIPSAHFAVSQSGTFNDLIYNPTAGVDRLPNGDYEITIAPNTIADAAGNTLASQYFRTTFFLSGDANRDRKVDFDDLLLLAQNYGFDGRLFSQGDFNYDGSVNFDDMLILAQGYGQSLALVSTAGSGSFSTSSGMLSSTRRRVADDLI